MKPVRKARRQGRSSGRLQLENLEQRTLLAASLDAGVLTVDGTDAADLIRVDARGSNLVVSIGRERQSFALADVEQIQVNALDGNDRVSIGPRVSLPATVDGGAGDDQIAGGGRSDQIIGGAGADLLFGGAGDDNLDGGDDADKLDGGTGTDTVLGGAGNDTMVDTSGTDSLEGGDGENNVVTDLPTRPGRPGRRERPGGTGPGGGGVGGPGGGPGHFIPNRPDYRIPRTPGDVLVGWDGTGQGSAHLTYYFGNLTSDLAEDATKDALRAALAVWANVVDVVFTETDTPGLANSIDFLFATGNHGDGSSFDGAGGELAHTFLPVNTSNPIAGDVHFDDAETWEVGDGSGSSAYDLLYVAVHEIGHALGLLHSSDPTAVMFESVSATTAFAALAASDFSAILALYAPAVTTATVTASDASSDSTGSSVVTIAVPNSADSSQTDTTETGTTETGTTETGTTETDTTETDTTETGTTETDTTETDTTETDTTETDTTETDTTETDTTETDTTETDTTETDTTGTDTTDFGTTDSDTTDTDTTEAPDCNDHGPIAELDANEDGVLTADEVPEAIWEHLVRADADGDGSITADELAAALPARPPIHDPLGARPQPGVGPQPGFGPRGRR